MPITTVIIISLLLANLSLTLIMFWILHSVLDAAKSLQDSNDLVKNSFEICRESIESCGKALTKVYERESALNEVFESAMTNIKDSYDNILEAYKIMRKQYDSIADMNSELLKCWKGCEERYSQSYEQFKHCSDSLKEVSFQLTDLANVSTADEYTLTLMEACDTVCLECPYEDCRNGLKYKDKMLDCPVWKIKSNQREIEAELEETEEFLREKARNEYEWTDDDYRDAVNTHLEDIQEGADDDR